MAGDEKSAPVIAKDSLFRVMSAAYGSAAWTISFAHTKQTPWL
jgi:hypothetical protein